MGFEGTKTWTWKHVALILWLGFIFVMYVRHHPLQLGCPGNDLSSCASYWDVGHPLFYGGVIIKSLIFMATAPKAIILFGATILYALWAYVRAKSGQLELRLTVTRLYIYLTSGTIVTIYAFLIAHAIRNNLDTSYLLALWNIVHRVLFVALAVGSLLFVAIVIGNWLLRKLQTISDRVIEHGLLSLGLGLVVISYVLFTLGSFQLLTQPVVSVVLVGLCALLWKSTRETGQLMTKHSWTVSWKAFSGEAVLWGLMLFMFAIHATDLMQPYPNGWDAIYRYVNTPNLLAQKHALFGGLSPYPFELIMSIGTVVWHSIPVTQWISSSMGLLASITLFAIARRYASRTHATLVTALFYLTPIVTHQSAFEVKIDLPLFFFSTLVLLVLYQILVVRPVVDRRWIVLLGLLIGFCFTMKYTAIFVVICTAVTYAATTLLTRTHTSRHVLGRLILLGVVMVLPFLPWMGKHIAESNGLITMQTIQRGASAAPEIYCSFDNIPALTENASSQEISNTLPQAFTGNTEDVGRYWGYGDVTLKKYLLLPWDITMSTTITYYISHISFVYLGLLIPLLLLFFVRTNKQFLFIGIYTALYWVLWIIFGRAVIWYGLPGFAGLSLVLAWQLETLESDKILRRVLYIAMTLSTLMMFFLRLNILTAPATYNYISGNTTKEGFMDEVFPKYQQIVDRINNDIPTTDSPKYVYRMGTFLPFFIKDNEMRLYNDDQLDMFSCLMQVAAFKPANVSKQLKDQGFKYIVVSPNIAGIDNTPEKTLTKKATAMADVVNRGIADGNFEILVDGTQQSNKILLLEIQ